MSFRGRVASRIWVVDGIVSHAILGTARIISQSTPAERSRLNFGPDNVRIKARQVL